MKDTEVSPTGKKMSQKKKKKKKSSGGKKKIFLAIYTMSISRLLAYHTVFFLQSKIEKKIYRETLLHVFYLAMDKAKKKVTAEEG